MLVYCIFLWFTQAYQIKTVYFISNLLCNNSCSSIDRKGLYNSYNGCFSCGKCFPAIGMISQLDVIRRNRLIGKLKFGPLLLKAVKAIVCASVVSMMGAMFLSGILSDVEFFLEMSIFRGIKLTFVLPIILVAIAFMQRFDIFGDNLLTPPAFKEQAKRILNMTVSVKALVGF